MSGLSQIYQLLTASERQERLLKKILRLLEAQTTPTHGDAPPLRELGTIPD